MPRKAHAPHRDWKALGFKKQGLRPKGPGDWTAPGYNYLGPGNPVDQEYFPVDEDDYQSYLHDVSEDYKTTMGYTNYNVADDMWLHNTGYGWGGNVGQMFFRFKKWLAAHNVLGILDKQTLSNLPPSAMTTTPPKLRGKRKGVSPDDQMSKKRHFDEERNRGRSIDFDDDSDPFVRHY